MRHLLLVLIVYGATGYTGRLMAEYLATSLMDPT